MYNIKSKITLSDLAKRIHDFLYSLGTVCTKKITIMWYSIKLGTSTFYEKIK